MPFIPISNTDIEIGKPTKKEIFQTLKDDLDYFDTELEALQQTAKFDIFDIRFSGNMNQYTLAEASTRVPVYKAPVSGTIISFVATLLSTSTSGTLELNIERSSDNGVNWDALLSAPVQLTGITVGSLSGSVNWIDVTSQAFAQNDLLRVTIDGVQVDQGNFHLSIYGELG